MTCGGNAFLERLGARVLGGFLLSLAVFVAPATARADTIQPDGVGFPLAMGFASDGSAVLQGGGAEGTLAFRLDERGTRTGPVFSTGPGTRSSSIVVLPDGSFWSIATQHAVPDGPGTLVARLFAADDGFVTELVMDDGANFHDAYRPPYGALVGSSVVAVWLRQPWDPDNFDPDNNVWAGVIAADGSSFSSFQLNQTVAGSWWIPRAAALGPNTFAVSWIASDTETGETRLVGRVFDLAGVALSDEFTVVTGLQSELLYPVLAGFGTGAMFFGWSETSARTCRIMGRVFLTNGTPSGDPFEVGGGAVNESCSHIEASADADGNLVVAWSGSRKGLKDHSSGRKDDAVFARRFDSTGQPRGKVFQVNTHGRGHQGETVLAVGPAGSILAGWATFAQGLAFPGVAQPGVGPWRQFYSSRGAACPVEPLPTCAGVAEKSRVTIKANDELSPASSFKWKWRGLASVSGVPASGVPQLSYGDFGNPQAGLTDYSVCVYYLGPVGPEELVGEFAAAASSELCPLSGGGCWKQGGRPWNPRYSFAGDAISGPVKKIKLKHRNRKEKVLVKAGGQLLGLPEIPALLGGLRAQLINSNHACWEAYWPLTSVSGTGATLSGSLP